MKNRDFLAVNILIILLTVGFVLTFGQHGAIFTDCSREILLPAVAFDKYNIMYRDIFNLYPVFTYQFNGILYKIFGENFNVLYFAGYINTILILCAFYGISRIFLNIKISFSLGLFFLLYSVFGIINPYMDFFLPYSYAYVYSLSTFLISLFCFLKFSQKNNFNYLLFSSFFMGISVACKFEFALTLLIYLISIIVLKIKIPFKTIMLSVFLIFLPSFLSYGYLIFQGLSYQDIINYIEFGKRFFQSESYHQFSKAYPKSAPICFGLFLVSFSGFIPLFFYLTKERKIQNLKSIFLITIFIIIGLLPNYYLFDKQLFLFYWICFTSFFICSYLIFLLIKNFSKNDFLFFIVCAAYLCSAIKYGFCLSKASYGNYIIPLFVMIHIIFLKNYCGKFLKKYNFTNFISLVLISFSVLNTMICLTYPVYKDRTYKIETNKGLIYETEKTGQALTNLIQYIKENTSEKDTILVLQEGAIINFLTDRPTNLMLYHLINIHIEALGEDYIIKNLDETKPDYIVTTGISHLTPDIKDYIKQNYLKEKSFDYMAVYKHKK